jgi:aspartokinase/homoserine dehydrogenase 1
MGFEISRKTVHSHITSAAAGEISAAAAAFQQLRRVNLAIAGPTGKVGRALLGLLQSKSTWLKTEHRLDLRVIGSINTRTMQWDERGLTSTPPLKSLRPVTGDKWDAFLELATLPRQVPLVFLDCTASEIIARQYVTLLNSGVAIVTPSKIAPSLDFGYYEQLHKNGGNRRGKFRYETTVGAATPMIRTLRDLRRTGDRIFRIEGVLSGTLSFVFDRVSAGVPFSHAVREAYEKGYTEPHPARDLSGDDVARKLLILAREAGFRIERSDIPAESLAQRIPEPASDLQEYLHQLAILDEEWGEKHLQAKRNGKRLVYLAKLDGERATVRTEEVSEESPFARLRGAENAVLYYTDRNSPLPLTIQGLGAGPETTARGVLADLIHTALELAA